MGNLDPPKIVPTPIEAPSVFDSGKSTLPVPSLPGQWEAAAGGSTPEAIHGPRVRLPMRASDVSREAC